MGKPTKRKLTLWTDDAAFEDPLTTSKGRKQYEAQWYGLAKIFSEIERLSHRVTDAGNPIHVDLKTRYKIAGIGKEQVIESKVLIETDQAGENIVKVQDRWDGELPDSAFKNVSLLSPFSLVHYAESWAWWLWSFTWKSRGWQVCGMPTAGVNTSLMPEDRVLRTVFIC